MQSNTMESHRAEEHLQVIRTLMERAAVYRRALAPTAFLLGGLGAVGAAAGVALGVDKPWQFALYWLVVCAVAQAVGLLQIRRQAMRDGEAFWSPPLRQVTRAMVPTQLVGLVAAAAVFVNGGENPRLHLALPAVWMVLYGFALHAAGFFMPRGVRWLGWVFLTCGSLMAASFAAIPSSPIWQTTAASHGAMGLAFGGLHLALGAYLSATEKRRAAA
jgi:hypothetical protein